MERWGKSQSAGAELFVGMGGLQRSGRGELCHIFSVPGEFVGEGCHV